jgi:hypothetical protein
MPYLTLWYADKWASRHVYRVNVIVHGPLPARRDRRPLVSPARTSPRVIHRWIFRLWDTVHAGCAWSAATDRWHEGWMAHGFLN